MFEFGLGRSLTWDCVIITSDIFSGIEGHIDELHLYGNKFFNL
ncbi:hypothetical protein SCA6_003759, partial [Theobroma cacao]